LINCNLAVIPQVERPSFHIAAILGFEQPFLAVCTVVRAFDAQLSPPSGLEGWIDWDLGLMDARFCGPFEPLLFRFHHLRFIRELAVRAAVGSL
jgi:hypothetical protein